MRTGLAGAALALAMSFGGTGTASADYLDDCAHPAPDMAIIGCSQAIDSGELSGGLLSWAYSNRGHAHLQLRQNGEAEQDFNRALKHNAYNLGALNGRGIARSRREEHRGALDDFEAMLEIDPGNATALNNGAYAKLALGFPQEALEDARRAVAMDPMNGVYRDTLGDMLGFNCRIDDAMVEFDLADLYMPDWAEFKLEQLKLEGYWDGPITAEFPEEARFALMDWIGRGCAGV